jgi:hypothetical protein
MQQPQVSLLAIFNHFFLTTHAIDGSSQDMFKSYIYIYIYRRGGGDRNCSYILCLIDSHKWRPLGEWLRWHKLSSCLFFLFSLNDPHRASKPSKFSAPWMHATLLNSDTYVGSPEFLSNLVWLKTGNQNDLMCVPVDSNDASSERATCSIVGTVSPVRLYLEPHGNFNPMFDNSALETSKLQFQLISPEVHPEFIDDFKLGLERVEKLQNKVITDGPDGEHFIVSDGRTRALKFSWPLFEKRVCTSFSHVLCC